MDNELHSYETAAVDRYGLLKDFAQRHRSQQTNAEALLWDKLKKNRFKIKFRRQHIIGDFIADFVCLRHKLVIEIDGGYHSQTDQQIKDAFRTDILENMGYKVIRFANEKVEANATAVAEKIFDLIFEIESQDDR